MATQSFDTDPRAERFQLTLIRKASIAKRISSALSLSQIVIQLSKRAIKRANPTLNEEELNIAFIAAHYGADLAERLREYFSREGTKRNKVKKRQSLPYNKF